MDAERRPRFAARFRALAIKEFRQILRDRRLVISLTVAPVLQLLLFGSVLNASVANVTLGVVDDSRTPESRELVAVMTQSGSFRLAGYYPSVSRLGDAIARGRVDAGVVISYDFARSLLSGQQTTLQFLLNAMNVNTAQISKGYAQGIVQAFNADLAAQGIRASQIAVVPVAQRGSVSLNPAFVFNPGLVSTWFVATGVLGMLLILNGAILSSAVMLKEREVGTIEQLLMSPASTGEILLSKIAPLFLLLSAMALLALAVIRVAFGVPVHGSLWLVLAGSTLCLLSGIGIGTMLATFARTSQQAMLSIFFINPPLSSLSGALMPVEAMPKWIQPLTVLNPIFHFGRIIRGALLKGSGLDVLWPNLAALAAFTVLLVGLSVWRFRKQLA